MKFLRCISFLLFCVQLPAAVDSMNRFQFDQKADDFSASSSKNPCWDLNSQLKMVLLDPVNERVVIVQVPASAFTYDGFDVTFQTHYGTLNFVTESQVTTLLAGLSLTPGPTGATGATGATGSAGATGAAGTNGSNGTNATTTSNATGSVAGLESAADKTKLDSLSTKRRETYSGTTDSNGLYTITFGASFSVAPNIQGNVIGQSTEVQSRIVSVSTTGFQVHVFQRVAVLTLALSTATSNVASASVDVLITEK